MFSNAFIFFISFDFYYFYWIFRSAANRNFFATLCEWVVGNWKLAAAAAVLPTFFSQFGIKILVKEIDWNWNPFPRFSLPQKNFYLLRVRPLLEKISICVLCHVFGSGQKLKKNYNSQINVIVIDLKYSQISLFSLIGSQWVEKKK